jgi:acyl-homoserine lactone acylase PvdQ
LNIGPLSAGGCLTTINNAQFSLIHPYDSDLGPSMRMIVDMSKKEMLSVITSGESGQPFSRHYDDQSGLWLNGGYINITIDRNYIPQAGWETLVLEK